MKKRNLKLIGAIFIIVVLIGLGYGIFCHHRLAESKEIGEIISFLGERHQALLAAGDNLEAFKFVIKLDLLLPLLRVEQIAVYLRGDEETINELTKNMLDAPKKKRYTDELRSTLSEKQYNRLLVLRRKYHLQRYFENDTRPEK
jgi:hypothetical protein